MKTFIKLMVWLMVFGAVTGFLGGLKDAKNEKTLQTQSVPPEAMHIPAR